MADFINRPEDCPHTEVTVDGYNRTSDPDKYIQVRQCTLCGLYQTVDYTVPPKPVTP